MNFGISTSWNAFRYSDGGKMILEIKKLGFEEVELSFNLTSSMVNDIQQLTDSKAIKVRSLHNYCPAPEDFLREEALPDCYSLSSQVEDQREKAISFTQRTIENASRLGARCVVLHCGRVEIADKTSELIKLYENGMVDSDVFKALSRDMISEREHYSKPYFENTLKSLDRLNEFARKKNILLGVENRFYFREIPSLQEIGLILDKFRGSSIFYWHDVGHAQLMENLGISRYDEYLKPYADSLIGIHLHDIRGCCDHLAPLKGEFDYSRLKPYLKKDTLKIIEAHHPASAHEIVEGVNSLKNIFGEI